ncbi:Scr1 family TA system antitoxin-like transcriptional regulator [Lentzea sp. NPDC102401]|uniref:Scr1 family TA system antitoxin-like transcriptional regulator n=1 Tax=Lentzea sp. NPDC102401 TaxID=3364128 RepID=UPI0037F6F6D0
MLRALRQEFPTGSEFAERLDWDPSKISNIERGKVRPTELDLAQYLTACSKGKSAITEFTNHYRNAFESYFAQNWDNFETIAHAERSATTITGYGKESLPVLLRTVHYTERLLQERGATPEQIQDAIRSQRERQRILYPTSRPSCLFYVAETALSAPLNVDRERMDQFELVRRMSRFIRIIPTDKRLPASTDFTIYERDKAPATVVAECEFARVFVHDGSAVSQCRAALAALDDVALSPAESKILLSRLLAEEYVTVLQVATGEQPTAS